MEARWRRWPEGPVDIIINTEANADTNANTNTNMIPARGPQTNASQV